MEDAAGGAGRRITVPDGVVGGLLAGLAVAGFFLVLDVVQAEALRTPGHLAQAVLGLDDAIPGTATILLFSLLHLAVFAAIGVGAVLLFRWAGLPQNVLLGAVYGLFVSTLLFYASLIVTGARVLPAPWWSAVLVGNLVAGFVLGGYLHVRGPRPGITGLFAELERHNTVREGLIAGLIGGFAVALWFLLVDLVLREPFFTPGALGSALLVGVEGPEEVRITTGTVLGYTTIHFAAFLLFGVVLAGLVAQAEKFPPLVWALVLLLVVFEVLFVGLVAMLGVWILAEIAWWSVLVGNLLAAVGMGGYLWRAHPVLQLEIRTGEIWGGGPGGPRH